MLAGARLAVVASRLFQGCASSSPSIGGIAAADPVATTTAFLALRTSSPTTTVFSPSSLPVPRITSRQRSSSQGSCPVSSRSWITSSRLARAAETSRSPVTAWETPGTRFASSSSSSGRSSAFEGMQA